MHNVYPYRHASSVDGMLCCFECQTGTKAEQGISKYIDGTGALSAAVVPQTSQHSCGVEALSVSSQRISDTEPLASACSKACAGASIARELRSRSANKMRAALLAAFSVLATSATAQVIEFRDGPSGVVKPAFSDSVIEFGPRGALRRPETGPDLSASQPAFVLGGTRDLHAHAARLADLHGIPRSLFTALISQESGWNQKAISPKGAIGLAQLMPATARYLRVDPRNPYENLEGGARYLAEQKRRFGSWKLALAAYNAGPGRVEEYGGIPPFRETQNYVQTIISGWRKNS